MPVRLSRDDGTAAAAGAFGLIKPQTHVPNRGGTHATFTGSRPA